MPLLVLTTSGTLGDHFPLLALGQALVSKGHQVRYAGPSYLRHRIEECGMQFHLLRPEMDPAKVRSQPDDFDHWLPEKGGPQDAVDRASRKNLSQDWYDRVGFEQNLADLTAACQGADMLISSQIQPTGRTASELSSLPWVTVCVTPWLHPSADTSAASGIAARESHHAQLPATRQFRDRIHDLRRRINLPSIAPEDESSLFISSRILLATSPLFGTPAPQANTELVQTGFWLHVPPAWKNQPLPAAINKQLATLPAPLVLAFSSQPLKNPAIILDAHLEAAKRLKRPLVAQAGWAELNSPRFEAACQAGEAFLLPEGPQHEIFKRAAAVITHGGIGTVVRSLQAGCPLLIEPYGNDQFYNARQVIALGVGAAVNPHRLTPEGLAQVLQQQVLTQEAKAKAMSISNEFDSAQALEQACQQINLWLSKTA